MESLGTKLRRQRRRLGLTLDELAGRTQISKPYLSLIETGRVPNPPSDEKLRRLEQTLGFPPGELLTQAHLQRTPRDVRAMLAKLMREGKEQTAAIALAAAGGKATTAGGGGTATITAPGSAGAPALSGIDLDDAYLSGVLHELVDRSSGNVEAIATNAVPVINKVSAGYPKDFTDLAYPRGVADDYVSCPDVRDPDAFAARVHGDSMTPRYTEGDIVIFSPAGNPRDGDDCFVRFEDGTCTFKRVFFEGDEDGRPVLRLQPRNEKYRPQVIPSEKVTGLYRAMYRYEKID
ncbi:MAG TPA: XRE family transcriptional regulator [Tepidisphaeraceae bacterium]|jgi:phage repressor protein C with HTH and peptisase S24 domain|nr:XRE family transcriptional regulator [Tepidisphaeraceae bacterium]